MPISAMAPQPYAPGSFATGDAKVARLQGLAAKASRGERLSADEQRDVAQQFEALMLKQLLKQTTSSMLSGSMFGDGPAADHYQDLFNEKMAEVMATTGEGIGVAQEIQQALQRDEADRETELEHRYLSLEEAGTGVWGAPRTAAEYLPVSDDTRFQPVPESMYADRWYSLAGTASRGNRGVA